MTGLTGWTFWGVSGWVLAGVWWVSGSQWYRDRTQAVKDGAYSADEHLTSNLSGSGYSISRVQFYSYLDEFSCRKMAYESLSVVNCVSRPLDIRRFHAIVFPTFDVQA